MRRRVPLILGLLLAATDARATPMFTDWVSFDAAGDSASGTLGTTAVTIAGGDIEFADTTGSSGIFATSHFTPPIPSGDFVEITGSFTSTFTYTLTFSAPVADPILHIGSLASMITFSGVTPTKLSGEAEFVVTGSTVTGQSPLSGGYDRNGTVVLTGTFSSVTFTVDALGLYANARDGIALQVGADLEAVPEPSVGTLVVIALLAASLSRCAMRMRIAAR
jgi:hypothetical protein